MLRKILSLLLFINVHAWAQINYQNNGGSITILPNSTISPITKITPFVIEEIEDPCGNPDLDLTTFRSLPWFGNNAYIYQYLDSIGYPLSGSNPAARVETSSEVKYRIPIKFWVYRRTDGTGGVTEAGLKVLMTKINSDFRSNNTGIRFFQSCSVSFINDSDKLILKGVDMLTAPIWVGGRTTNGAINVHIVEDIRRYGGLYTPLTPHSVFIEWQTAFAVNASTLSHEIGHLFRLQHTHSFSNYDGISGWRNCLVEPIDRNRRYADFTFCHGSSLFQNTKMCEVTGDALSDTPADPKLNVASADRISSCIWIDTNLTDHFGDVYGNPPPGSSIPDARNVMSYSPNECGSIFSYGQIGVMVHSIEKNFILLVQILLKENIT